jgi:transposase
MRYQLTDEEWTAIKPMLPNKPRGMSRVNERPSYPQWHLLSLAIWGAMARFAGQLRSVDDLLQSLRSLATSGRLGQDHECTRRGS